MKPVEYHEGQRAIQREANSIVCADKLSTWVGPVAQFASGADLIVLASSGTTGLPITALSGPPPLVSAREADGELIIEFPRNLRDRLPAGQHCGGIVTNLAEAKRARISGVLADQGDRLELECQLGFANCRKYMAATRSTGAGLHIGPVETVPIPLTDPWLIDVVRRGETAFLVTTTPDGSADVSHRGGQPGFLKFDAGTGSIGWTEYLGDGMFLSTGNLRAGGHFALVVLDFVTGDAARLDGHADYLNIRGSRKARVDALIQDGEPFPVQGRVAGQATSASRLTGFCLPRVVTTRTRITSTDSAQVQHP